MHIAYAGENYCCSVEPNDSNWKTVTVFWLCTAEWALCANNPSPARSVYNQQARDTITSRQDILEECCPIVFDADPTLSQHWFNILCFARCVRLQANFSGVSRHNTKRVLAHLSCLLTGVPPPPKKKDKNNLNVNHQII